MFSINHGRRSVPAGVCAVLSTASARFGRRNDLNALSEECQCVVWSHEVTLQLDPPSLCQNWIRRSNGVIHARNRLGCSWIRHHYFSYNDTVRACVDIERHVNGCQRRLWNYTLALDVGVA